MFRKLRNWLNEPESKIVKKTAGSSFTGKITLDIYLIICILVFIESKEMKMALNDDQRRPIEEMFRKLRNWLNEPESKIVKKTYADGEITYTGFIRLGSVFEQGWEEVKDYYDFSRTEFNSLEAVQKLIDSKIKKYNARRIVDQENIYSS